MTIGQFHYGLFSSAMVQLLGRDPDIPIRMGFDGFYHFVYKPKNKEEAEKFAGDACTLREWLRTFNLRWPDSKCEFGTRRTDPFAKDLVLEIILYVPQELKT